MWFYCSQNNQKKGKSRLQMMLQKANKKNSEIENEDDHIVLQNYLWPEVENHVIQHDAYLCNMFPGSIPFHSQRSSNRDFVGCSVHN